ncbi:LysR family transcriptional regulator [uncultured Cocleimonas sp.]|uniref:LysR family transcriptional regulator n=1 Tax=uncultured Cocleimonas sp. TaxID=1051587 RepID=UPI0026145F31|nr:LysR family transcriptional regulator [uncultured Cocleimonas sp.]
MDISAYKAFISVAELGTFSKAAEHLYITQPAVSKRIALLEEQLGSKLFDRIGKRVMLNEAGRALLPIAERILQDMKESQRVIDNLNGQVSGELSLVTSHHIGLHRLPDILKNFTESYPQVRLDLAFMDSEDACHEIEKGHFELGVVTLPLSNSKRLKITPLWNDPLTIAVSPDHPLVAIAKDKAIILSELAKHSAILPAVGTYTRSVIEKPVIQKQGALDVILETNYLETIRMMVTIGLGWSALPKTMLGDDLTEIKVKGLKIERTLGIVQHASRSLSNAGKAFIQILEKHTPDN